MTFQSTRLLRGATASRHKSTKTPQISIHAPLARRDYTVRFAGRRVRHFNPRASCEARRATRCGGRASPPFQSTRLLRGATCRPDRLTTRRAISIHAPLARRDATAAEIARHWQISIHAPLARRDFRLDLLRLTCKISIHAPLARRDLCRQAR